MIEVSKIKYKGEEGQVDELKCTLHMIANTYESIQKRDKKRYDRVKK